MPVFQTEEEIGHWLTNRADIVTCYVVEVSLGEGERERVCERERV